MAPTPWKLSVFVAIGLGLAAAATAQDFDGAYVGLYGATGTGDSVEAGTFAGYRFRLTERTYLGAEADVLIPSGGPSGGTDFLAAGLGSFSYEVLPDTLLYGRTGLALDGADNSFWVAGAGVDFAVSDGVSLRLGGDRYDDLSTPATDWVAKAGVALSF